MKTKILSILVCIIAVLSLFPFASFANGSEEILKYDPSKYVKGQVIELNVYNWGEYISDGSEDSFDSNKEFEKYCLEKFGIEVRVNYSTFDNNELMYSKIKSSAVSYDVIIPSDYIIQKMANEGLLTKFDAESIPNYKNIDPKFKNSYYDENNMYSVPYSYGMVGIIWNSSLVDEEDVESQSWGIMWSDKYRGKILQFNNPRDAFASAMYWTGKDINSTEEDVWNETLKLLKQQKPLLKGYVNDEIFVTMEQNSAAVAAYYAGDYLTMSANNENLRFYYPKEGTNYFVDAMCIPISSKNPYLAMEYINFMLAVEEGNEENSAAIANALYIGYATPNMAVRNNQYYIDTLTSDDYYGEEAETILYGADPIKHNESYAKKIGKGPNAACYQSFSPEIQEHVNELWENLKTENSTELWVHITSITIVVGVLAIAIYDIYIKKKRSKDYRARDKAKLRDKNSSK